jgi:proline iminopeptidase
VFNTRRDFGWERWRKRKYRNTWSIFMKRQEEQGFTKSEVITGKHKVVAYQKHPLDKTVQNRTVLCLNGGPGLPCDYLRDSHAMLCDHGYHVVSYDQLGTGQSDNPDDPSLWTIERYTQEVEAVRDALGLGKVHLLGHSWGGWLAIEYAITYPENIHSLILQGTAADIPLLLSEMERLRNALGSETSAMMRRYEAEKDWNNPEYMAAITLLNHRHVCRLPQIPPAYQRSKDGLNSAIYNHMQGPNEFHYIGNLRNWSRTTELMQLKVPALVTAGQFDEITPACARQIGECLNGAEVRIFPNSSHHPHFEEPDAFFPVLIDFLNRTTADLDSGTLQNFVEDTE